ncbi:MAG TPA: carboxypeptidase regulatory-like domain-containing protein [Candidatus Sulfotelmatobacter sp.]|nr:carboxypeptidase regulatory-like domain-containing protein [Candidatus Sulfotelmatobacter sp.]
MKRRILQLAVLVTMFLLVGCSGKKEPQRAEETTTTSAQQATPIDQATVGEITGKVSFAGEKPQLPVIHMDQDPVCVSKHNTPVHVDDGEVNANATLPNVFVYIKEGAENYRFATPTQPVTLDQNGCMYQPHVVGVMVGQDLHIISSDQTTHNIHPMPKDNREWNESQPPGAAPLDKQFVHSEIMIPVKCNQHPWMKAYVGVVKNPFYDVTGSDGTFTIKGIPPGDYTLEAWTATFGVQDQKLTVAPKATETVNFTFKPLGGS